MLTDPIAAAGLVTREVQTGRRGEASTKVAIARRTYATDQGDLWDALTNIDRIPRWFLPISGELAVGGRYQLDGNAGGIVERCDAPHSFVVTWEMGPMMSWVTVSLSPVGGGTTLELVHEAAVDPDMWNQFGPGAVGVGWDLALALGLELHLASGDQVDPAAAEAYTLSPGGIAFVRASAAGWAAAAVADGDDPDGAAASAEATVAFYTTLPSDLPGD